MSKSKGHSVAQCTCDSLKREKQNKHFNSNVLGDQQKTTDGSRGGEYAGVQQPDSLQGTADFRSQNIQLVPPSHTRDDFFDLSPFRHFIRGSVKKRGDGSLTHDKICVGFKCAEAL